MPYQRLLALLLAALLVAPLQPGASASQAVDHIVIIWLKQPGNVHAQETIIKASESLAAIPGVTALKSGRVVPGTRPVVDSSFDVALVISFVDKAALDAYLVHPVHQRLLNEVMKPLVQRIRVYDMR